MRAVEDAKKSARANQLDEARDACARAIAADPRNEEAYLLSSSISEMKEDQAGSKAALEQGLAQLPQSAALRHAHGMFALERQEIELAVRELEAARRFAGSREKAEILADLAYAYLFANRLEDAEKIAKESRTLDSKAYAAAFTHGEALFRLARFDAAAEAYRAAAALAPDDPLPRSRLASSLMKSGDFAGAIEPLEALLKTEKESPARLHAALAQAKLELKRGGEALRHAEEAVRLAPKESAYLELLAKIQESNGDQKGAKATRKKLAGRGKAKS